jgi:hypothetical protein
MVLQAHSSVTCAPRYERDAEIGQREFDLKMTDRVNMKVSGKKEKRKKRKQGMKGKE